MDATERRWRIDFVNAHDAIPESWLVHGKDDDGEDGTCINPDHRDDPVIKAYKSLALVGFARGWMP